MEGSTECLDALICSGARRLAGYQRRLFMAEVATKLCEGSARQAERRFGWGRETVLKGLHETRQGMRCLENFVARGRLRSEEKDPQLAADIRAIVEPHTYADPELKSSRRYTNLSAAEVRQAFESGRGPAVRKVSSSSADLPASRPTSTRSSSSRKEHPLQVRLRRHPPSIGRTPPPHHPSGIPPA